MQGGYELAVKVFRLHCEANILHSVVTLSLRIQVMRTVWDGFNKTHKNLVQSIILWLLGRTPDYSTATKPYG